MENRRRLETAALLLPIFGALLIVPPLIGVFNIDVTIFGMPLVAIYLFAVWIGLIGATALLSKRLQRDEQGGETQRDEDRAA